MYLNSIYKIIYINKKVQDKYHDYVGFYDEVAKIFSNDFAFAALTVDGKLITWGHPDFGGDAEILLRNEKVI